MFDGIYYKQAFNVGDKVIIRNGDGTECRGIINHVIFRLYPSHYYTYDVELEDGTMYGGAREEHIHLASKN